MKNIILIVGARPNFMKAFPVYEVLKNYFNLTLIHTGQHFDKKMSNIFFEQLKFPRPDIHLSLYKRTKAGDFDDKLYVNNEELLNNKDKVIEDLIQYQGELGQMGEIRDKLKKEFEKLKPDLVIVFGDVTSTLASGLAAKTLNIDLAHVESGLRSGDIKMPEEVNRILTDHISKYFFITEQSGVDNLRNSGITENVHLVGNTMIDTQKKYLQQALNTKYQETLGVKSRDYALITLHRPGNVDDLDKLKEIFDDLEELSKTEKLVYPIHPRTKNNLEKLGYLKKVENNENIVLEEPLGYLEFTCLIANCKYVITDSGGIQEETTALDIPCFTLRENTERPSTLIKNNGTNQMIHKVNEIELKECKGSMELWDGKSSERILKNLNHIVLNEYKLKVNNLFPLKTNPTYWIQSHFISKDKKFDYIFIPKNYSQSFRNCSLFDTISNTYKKDSKIKIIILRNPLERYISSFLYELRNNLLSFKDNIIQTFLNSISLNEIEWCITCYPQYKYLEEKNLILTDFDVVLIDKTFKKNFEDFKNKYNLEIDYKELNMSNSSTDKEYKEQIIEYITNKPYILNRIKIMYKKDYELYENACMLA